MVYNYANFTPYMQKEISGLNYKYCCLNDAIQRRCEKLGSPYSQEADELYKFRQKVEKQYLDTFNTVHHTNFRRFQAVYTLDNNHIDPFDKVCLKRTYFVSK